MVSLVLVAAFSFYANSGFTPGSLPLTADSPQNALKVLERAYNQRSVDDLASLYSSDYQFHFSGQKEWTALSQFGRDDELRSARNLFHGLVKDGRQIFTAPDTIRATVVDLEENPDPEHPDSAAYYRLVAAHLRMVIVYKNSKSSEMGTRTLNVFQFVRGDAAVLADGQAADPRRWYIRNWFEDLDRVVSALEKAKGDCDPQPPSPAGATMQLAIHPLGNPACPTIDLQCYIPASGMVDVEVFDVTGRRVHQQRITVSTPGPQRIQAGAGATIHPGVYWVRLTQGKLRATKMVTVAS